MTIVERLGWVLLHFVWQGAVIALALAVLLALTREAQARLRYVFSCSALVLMLAATLVTATLMRTTDASAVQAGAAAALESSPLTAPAPAAGPADRSAGNRARVIPSAATGGANWNLQPIVDRAIPWLVMAWLAGVLLLTVRLLGGWWSTRALRVAGISPVPEWCMAQAGVLSARMAITRPVAIVASVRVTVPIILGHLKPVILLPAVALSGLSAAQIEAIVAHELAHVRRHEYLLNLAQTIIETLLFYHPAVWWVSRQVRESREHCCDDLAVAVCRSRREYVNALLELEELRGPMPALALGAAGGSLLARGRRLLAPAQARTAAAPRLAASVIALIGVTAAVASASFHSASVPTWSGPELLESGSTVPTPLQDAPRSETTPVTTAPDTAASLSTRWAWAEGAARTAGRRTYWIGYGVAPVKTLPPFIYNDRSRTVMADGISFHGGLFSTDAANLRFPGRALAVPPGSSGVKLLFELNASGRDPRLTAIHASTMSLPVDTKGLPVFWLGPADAPQSLDRVDRFYQATSNPELKDDLIDAAGVHDASAAVVAWLERRIASGDPEEIRGNAAEWIAWHPIPASISALDRTARTDRSSHVRQEAAEAMGDVALPEATPALIGLARSLSDTDARREAVEALGSRPEAAATDALAAIARDDANLDIQREAVETLGDFEDKRGVDVLIELARTHPRVDVRREAIEALGDAMPEGTAVERLKEFLSDQDPLIQEEAVDTIASIEDASSLETLLQLARSHTSTDIRRESVEALADRAHGQGEGKPDAELTKIIELLSGLATADREIDVQAEAIEALAGIGGTAVVAELQKLAGTHAEERVRVEAIESLGESGAPAAETAQFLKGLALAEQSEDVRSEAIETLADLHDRAGIAALIELAREHPSTDTRREALERLLESDHPDARALFERALKK